MGYTVAMDNPAEIYHQILSFWFVLSAVIALSLLFIRAPYGRHISGRWGPTLPNRLGWVVMETSVLILLPYYGLRDGIPAGIAPLFLGLIVAHYLYRSFIFPLMTHTAGKRMPLMIVLFALLHNWGNSYLLGSGFSRYGQWSTNWLSDPRFILGLAMFVGGFALHVQSDRTLIALRKPGDTGYYIPQGGIFRWVSCPNYLGEIFEWAGLAVLTWSPAALAFAVFTTANLAPRALAHHRWYQAKFPDYPPERKALLPGLL